MESFRTPDVQRHNREAVTRRSVGGVALPDLPALPQHTGRVRVLELHRQPAATGDAFYYLQKQDHYLQNNPSIENKTVLIQQLVSVAPARSKRPSALLLQL